MSYATYDFTESLNRVGIHPLTVDRVLAAWGHGDGQGEDAGHYRWAPDGATDWQGGFLMLLQSGVYVYVTGWCDYTGWGCQDGAEVLTFTEAPSLEGLRDGATEEDWDIEPADLNRWLKSEEARNA